MYCAVVMQGAVKNAAVKAGKKKPTHLRGSV